MPDEDQRSKQPPDGLKGPACGEAWDGGCVDIDMAIMLREETRKVQSLMEELFSKQANILGELHRQVNTISVHQQVSVLWTAMKRSSTSDTFVYFGLP